LVIVKKGDKDLPGLTDTFVPRRLGPKRASKIRKLFNLSKEDDVRQFVIKRQLAKKEGKKQQTRAPKIQRLVTPTTIRRKKHRMALKKQRFQKAKDAKAAYETLLAGQRKDKRAALLSKKRSVSTKVAPAAAAPAAKKAAAPKAEKPVAKKAAVTATAPAAKKAAVPAAKKSAPKK